VITQGYVCEAKKPEFIFNFHQNLDGPALHEFQLYHPKDKVETKKASPKNLVPMLGGGFSEEAFLLINGLIISSFLPDIRRIGRI